MEEAETTVRDFMASGGALKRLFERLPSFRCAVEPLLRFYRTNPALRGCNAAQIGAVGEVLAWAFLTQNGYRVRYHAMETPNHLVDLMVRTDRGLLGVEVRTRN